jgi:hypothetical protein
VPLPAVPTATGCGCGRWSWGGWPPGPAWPSPCATFHRVPANGTASNTACAAHGVNQLAGPLASHEFLVQLIGATTSRTGVKVTAELDTATCPTGIQVSDQQLAAVPVKPHTFHGEWNYTIGGRRPPQPPTTTVAFRQCYFLAAT